MVHSTLMVYFLRSLSCRSKLIVFNLKVSIASCNLIASLIGSRTLPGLVEGRKEEDEGDVDSKVIYCLPVCLSMCLSMCVCLSVCLSVCVRLSMCLSVCLIVCLSNCLSVCLSNCLSLCLIVCLSVCLSLSLCLSFFVSLLSHEVYMHFRFQANFDHLFVKWFPKCKTEI